VIGLGRAELKAASVAAASLSWFDY